MHLSQLFSPALSLAHHESRSKKRLFETVSQHLVRHHPDLTSDQIFDALTARERLGSTGLGEGVAVPHCRIKGGGLESTGMLVQLAVPLEFDAPDQKPVDILAFLLVTGEAQQEHLDTLAAVAAQLSDADTRNALRAAETPDELCATMCGEPRAKGIP